MSTILTIPNFATIEECNDIFNRCINELELIDGKVYNSTGKTNSKMSRKSKIAFISNIGNISERIISKIKDHVAEIKGYTPSLGYFQFTQYKEGDYFNWHSDSNNTIFKDRFYTIVLQLTNDYEGGEFQLLINGNEITLEKGIGNLFIFPAETIHRIKPVTENVRYSLVNWLKLKPVDNIKKTLL